MANKKSLLKGREAMVVGIIVAMVAVFSLLSPTFRTYTTFVSLLDCSYYVALMAIGVTFPLITGGVDLSIGTGLICYALFGGYLIVHKGMPVGVALVACAVVGTLIGLLNGYLVAVMDLPPFLASLCTCMINRGLGSLLSGGFGVSWPSALEPAGWFRSMFRFNSNGKVIPVGIFIIIALVIIMSFVLNHTKIGRYTFAIGSNKEATRLSGVNVVKWHMLAYIVCGIFTGFAGIAYAATFQAIAPGTGAGLELDAIAGAIIGGTSMTGGSGSIVGTILGVFVMSMLKTGLPFIGLQANWQQIITGLVLIAAVFIDVVRTKKR